METSSRSHLAQESSEESVFLEENHDFDVLSAEDIQEIQNIQNIASTQKSSIPWILRAMESDLYWK